MLFDPKQSTQEPIDWSFILRLFLKIMNDWLIAILVTHDEKVDLPSKLLRWVKALRKESWGASSASSQFLVIPICRSQKCAEVTVSELREGTDISVLCSHDQRLVAHLS